MKAEGEWGDKEKLLLHWVGRELRRIEKSFNHGRGWLDRRVEYLGERNRQILMGLRRYRKQADIAAKLGLSPKTVSGLIRELCKMFEVSNQADLCALFTPESQA